MPRLSPKLSSREIPKITPQARAGQNISRDLPLKYTICNGFRTVFDFQLSFLSRGAQNCTTKTVIEPSRTSLFADNDMTRHHRQLAALLIFPLLLVVFAGGCSRDPNVRKQKFLEQGNKDYAKGRYAEAIISYGRALQLDPRFAEAHYKLAQSYMKQGSWAAGYQELGRTVALDPENWPAQLDIAKMLLAGNRPQDAKDKALLILKSQPANAEAQIVLSQANSQLGNQKDAMAQAQEAVATQPDHAAP
jgi:tetratricopeptide (TPR) repeat protein